MIRRSTFDEYLRQQCKSNDRENRLSLYEESDEDIVIEDEDETMRQGVLVPDLESGGWISVSVWRNIMADCIV